MKRFEFKLQKLLELRAIKEKEIQGELAQILGIQNRERLRQKEYREKVLGEKDKYREKVLSGKYSYMDALMFERFVEFADRVIALSQDKIDSMEPEIAKIRERLIEASRERKVIEKLKEKRWNEYVYEMNREIGKENDDMNQKIHQRKMLEEMM